jgi:hypothetical protein
MSARDSVPNIVSHGNGVTTAGAVNGYEKAGGAGVWRAWHPCMHSSCDEPIKTPSGAVWMVWWHVNDPRFSCFESEDNLEHHGSGEKAQLIHMMSVSQVVS